MIYQLPFHLSNDLIFISKFAFSLRLLFDNSSINKNSSIYRYMVIETSSRALETY